MVDTITYDEAEQIILATEPAAMSDKGDKIWTRRMAVALADVFNARLSSAALSGMAEPVAWQWEYLNSQLRGWESKITPYEPNASECVRDVKPLFVAPPASEREEIERLKEEAHHLRSLNDDAHAIINRIWAIFGTPSYEELAGRTIYDLVQDAVSHAALQTEERSDD